VRNRRDYLPTLGPTLRFPSVQRKAPWSGNHQCQEAACDRQIFHEMRELIAIREIAMRDKRSD
jgi:hypothetical protein